MHSSDNTKHVTLYNSLMAESVECWAGTRADALEWQDSLTWGLACCRIPATSPLLSASCAACVPLLLGGSLWQIILQLSSSRFLCHARPISTPASDVGSPAESPGTGEISDFSEDGGIS